MALANPAQIHQQHSLPQMPPLLDQQNLALLAGSPAMASLLLSHYLPPPSAIIGPSLPQPRPINLLASLPNIGQSVQHSECPERDDAEPISHKPPPSILAAPAVPFLPSQSATHQQLLDHAILELLLAKQNNALSLSFLPNFATLLPFCHSHANLSTAPIPTTRSDAAGMTVENGGNSPIVDIGNEHKFVHLDKSQLESLSRNKLGRSYNPGRPLGMMDRQKILELYQKGLKISHIAKVIGVTHSCVSKIMTRYRRTGSIHPRSAQLSILSRRQSMMLLNPSSTITNLPVPTPSSTTNSSPSAAISTIQFSGWQHWLPASNGNEMTKLKCTVPSAFQRISPLIGASSDDDEEKEDGGSSSGIGSSLDGRESAQQGQKAYLVERLLD